MNQLDPDSLIRAAAFEHVRRHSEVHEHLTASHLRSGFAFAGERIPLINPQRGIFKPQRMRFLLSIRTVYPKPGGKVWYDDQRDVHRQIFEGDETIDYAFMGEDPDAADNRWLREAFENGIPIIYFLGIAPGRYQAMLPWHHYTFAKSHQGPPRSRTARVALRAFQSGGLRGMPLTRRTLTVVT